ncbi:phosphatase PAP2 family protein [Methylibium sp. Pch-M]|uniref:phosphatase PAP2 family protein n=1 Tax=Methylibium sp. Pch-M TaxID=2082386 RepID=UPI001A922856|nr:phosphatase PAP2 family protein [Methylibium sp. Pch-M]
MDEARVLALVTAVGERAVPSFVLALACLLLFVASAWWLTRRHVLPRLVSPLPPSGFLALNLGLGFVIVVVSAAIFAGTADEIGIDEELGVLDTAFSDTLRDSVSLATLRVFSLLTRFGDTATLTVLCTVVAVWLWVVRKRWLALAWVIAIAGNGVLNTTLKGIFERVRPLHEHGLVHELGWSFPSGHSSGAVVAYGMLAYIAMRRLPPAWHLPALLLATAIAFTTGCSRIFLQVHFASDVLAGFASGLAWLTVCVVSTELTRRYRRAPG